MEPPVVCTGHNIPLIVLQLCYGNRRKKGRSEGKLKKSDIFSFIALSYHSTIGGIGGKMTFFSVTSCIGVIMAISGTVSEGLWVWFALQSLIC